MPVSMTDEQAANEIRDIYCRQTEDMTADEEEDFVRELISDFEMLKMAVAGKRDAEEEAEPDFDEEEDER